MVNFRLFFPTIFFNFPCKSTVLSNVSASFSRVRYWISIDWLLARPASDNKSVLSESESVQTEWRGSPDLHCWHHDTWPAEMVTEADCDMWHDVRVMFRLEAGCRDPDQERTPGKLWTRLRHQSHISPFLRHLSHGTQWAPEHKCAFWLKINRNIIKRS